jgi:hypothetical protein
VREKPSTNGDQEAVSRAMAARTNQGRRPGERRVGKNEAGRGSWTRIFLPLRLRCPLLRLASIDLPPIDSVSGVGKAVTCATTTGQIRSGATEPTAEICESQPAAARGTGARGIGLHDEACMLLRVAERFCPPGYGLRLNQRRTVQKTKKPVKTKC